MAVDASKLNTMRSPFVLPSWPAQINTFVDLSNFIDHPDSDVIVTAVYGVDFHHPRPPYHVRDDSAYVAEDLYTPFAFTLFGKLRADEEVRKRFYLVCPDDAPRHVQVAFGEQTQVLTQPVLQDDWDTTNTTAATCTDADRQVGRTGTFIEVQRGARCILHTLGEDSVETRHITPEQTAHLVAGAWVLLKCTLHKYDGIMASQDRDYEVCAWHVRILPDLEALSKIEQAKEKAATIEVMPEVSTPRKLRPRPPVKSTPKKLRPRASGKDSPIAEGPKTRSRTVAKRDGAGVVKAGQSARKAKAESRGVGGRR
ncbi:hypothetical protein C8R46DRAFT_1217993 [Mycena filopes]|nr:hypothetical protein C8R46DRAFT_1217993 [Mycena filopes]